MHTIKPLDEEAVTRATSETRSVFTVQDHRIIGGLGGAVAEYLAKSGIMPRVFKRIGAPDRFSPTVGDRDFLRLLMGSTPAGCERPWSVHLA